MSKANATLTGKQATTKMNEYKQAMTHISEGLPVREFREWKPPENPRQREMDEYRLRPSLVA